MVGSHAIRYQCKGTVLRNTREHIQTKENGLAGGADATHNNYGP